MDKTIRRKKIILIGGTKRAVNSLSSLLLRNDVNFPLAIFMRGYSEDHIHCDSLCEIAKSRRLNFQVEDKITLETENAIREMDCDAIICIGVWRTLLSDGFLKSTRYGFLGVHGSPLPRYRGFAGIYWQIINGDPCVTMRCLQLASGIDDGPLVAGSKGNLLDAEIDLNNHLHLSEILEHYESKHILLLNKLVDLVRDDEIRFIEQDQALATYSCHRGPEDGEINWDKSTNNIFNFIRAQSKPLQGAYTYFKGKKIIIWRALPKEGFSNYEGRICGKVVSRNIDKGSVTILTKDTAIEVIQASYANDHVDTLNPVDIFSTIRARCTSEVEAIVLNRNNRND